MIIWLDDYRNPFEEPWVSFVNARTPGDVVWVKNKVEFIESFVKNKDSIMAVYFDNDLGLPEEGKDIFKWLESYVRTNDVSRFMVYSQSSNPPARAAILAGYQSLSRWWDSK
jgi:hypothetical protein